MMRLEGSVPMTIDALQEKDICDVAVLEDDHDFRQFIKSGKKGISFVPERHFASTGLVIPVHTGAFVKWIRQNQPQLNVEVCKESPKLDLRSGEIWLPLAFLGSDVFLQVYLNMVANYLYDKMKGALQGDTIRVHCEAVYEDKKAGVTKKFTYRGDADGLYKLTKPFDLNKFMGE
jgi:hypothetical protein